MVNMTEDRGRHHSSSGFLDRAGEGCSLGFCDRGRRVYSHRKHCWHIDLYSRHHRRKSVNDHGHQWWYAYF